MAKAGAGGGGPDLMIIAAVGAMALFALRSTKARAAVPGTAVSQLRPDYTAQRNIAYTQAGLGLAGMISGMFGAGSPDAVISGGQVSGVFGGGTSAALDYNNLNGYIGQLGIDATDGYTPNQFGASNGALTFMSPAENPPLGYWMNPANTTTGW